MMRIRDLKRSDIPAVREVALASWFFAYEKIYAEKTILKRIEEYYSDESFERDFKQIKEKRARFFVAESGKKIVGYAHLVHEKNGWEVLRIYVRPKTTRKGIGTLLLKRVESFLKRKGVKRYILYPHVKNKIATNFYEKMGFQRNKEKDRGWNSPCFEKRLQ